MLTTTPPPLYELDAVTRDYRTGDVVVRALDGVSLRIEAGEMLAIVGASGSGKSTLLNLLGALDRPSAGRCLVDGEDTRSMGDDALAALRRRRFGFVFQRYLLLPRQDAVRNVEMPALYAGLDAPARRERARALLARLGLSDRLDHRPTELSGGQQQRVSIARALMNGGDVILADEPTGALDSRSGAELLALLRGLNARGHTVILVTHDLALAESTPRVVEMRDGRIVRDPGPPVDRGQAARLPVDPRMPPTAPRAGRLALAWLAGRLAPLRDAIGLAGQSLVAHRLRSALSVLGITIGIAAVVSIFALGDAARVRVAKDLQAFLADRLDVAAGNAELPAGTPTRAFDDGDIQALARLDGVVAVMPERARGLVARQGARNAGLEVLAVGRGEAALRAEKLVEGRDVSALDLATRAQALVLNGRARASLFPASAPALGRTVFLGSLPFEVVGVARPDGGLGGGEWREEGWIPSTTFADKIARDEAVTQLSVRLAHGGDTARVRRLVTNVLALRHRRPDFTVVDHDQQVHDAQQMIGLLQKVLSAIGGISLLVGGVGVMNIMLVAVTERTREIGIRLAVGARRGDIRRQFLVEAVALCLLGGVAGVAVAEALVGIGNALQSALPVVVSVPALVVAVAVSSSIGIVFGFLPAHQAARLGPVEALARE